MQGSGGTFSTTDDKEWEWIMVIKKGEKTKATVHRVCEAASNCTAEELALGMVILRGTGRELKALISKHRGEIETLETDALVHAIPDLAEDEGDMNVTAFLQEGSVRERPASWGLDRIDDFRGLDNSYEAPEGGGQGVHVYVTDSGIRTTHTDFGGRAIPTLDVTDGNLRECSGDADSDCAQDRTSGHGTHCAGTVGGSRFGVAKGVTLHAVKVLRDGGGGSFSWLIRALDWIVRKGERPAIISASLGATGQYHYVQAAFDRTVERGVTVVVAAGNEDDDACSYSPAHIGSAVTVGATSNDDRRAVFSNYGRCVDIFAPGVAIRSAGHVSDADMATMQGTSMACPHVTGAAALLLQGDPSLTPAAVVERLTSGSTPGVVTNARQSPNRMLYVGSEPQPPHPNPGPPRLTLSFGWMRNSPWKHEIFEVGSPEYYVEADGIVSHPAKEGSARMNNNCNWWWSCWKASQDFRETTLVPRRQYRMGDTLVLHLYEDDFLRDTYVGQAEIRLGEGMLGRMQAHGISSGGTIEIQVDRFF